MANYGCNCNGTVAGTTDNNCNSNCNCNYNCTEGGMVGGVSSGNCSCNNCGCNGSSGSVNGSCVCNNGSVGGVSTGDGMCYVAGLFTVIGHIAPVYYKFKGGKGVLATAVTVLMLAPIPFLILFAIFAGIVAISGYVSLASITSVVLLPVILHGYFAVVFSSVTNPLPGLAALSSIIIAILVVFCHKDNIQRISNKTERKFSFKKAPEVKKGEKSEENESED